MPPTIITANSNDKRAPPPVRPQDKRAELVTRVKYCNTLPDIPFDPKFVTYPFESTRFIQNNPTSLERNYKYEVLAEHDLGVTIDLINSDTYAHDPDAILSPFDEKLLEEDVNTPTDSRRSRHHAKSVSWLRRTEYISTEQTRFQPQTMDKVEAKVGYSIKKSFKDETLYMDRVSQIEAIEKTFQDSKIAIEKHYSKPNIVPVEVLPIYPDFKIWKYPCAQVIFDSDPAPVGRSVPAQIEEMSQAMIRGVMDESGEQFVAYFLPTEETMVQRKEDIDAGIEYGDESQYTYRMAREYNWTVKSKANKGYEENYFLVVRNDGVFYNELETRVRLNKRRQKQGHIQGSKTTLLVKHRPLNASEFEMQRYRERMLEPPGEEEEEEEANKSEEEEKMETDGEKESNKSNSDQEDGSDKESGDEKKGSGDESDRSDDKDASGDEKESGAEKSDREDASGDEMSDKGRSGSEKGRSGSEKGRSGSEKGRSGSEKEDSGSEKGGSGDEQDAKEKSGDEKPKAATSASSSSSSSSGSNSEDSE